MLASNLQTKPLRNEKGSHLNDKNNGRTDDVRGVLVDARQQKVDEGRRQRIKATHALMLSQQRPDGPRADVVLADHEREDPGLGQSLPD